MNWSISAHRTMRTCPRRFFYAQIHASHASRQPDRREAYVLKQLQGWAAFKGAVLHDVLAVEFTDFVRSRRRVDWHHLKSTAKQLAEARLRFSEDRLYRADAMSKRAAGRSFGALFAHEYGVDLPDDAIADAYRTIDICFDNLAGQRDFLAKLAKGYDLFTETQYALSLGDGRVVVTPDLAFWRAPRQLTIVDWKISSNETSEYSKQLLTYAVVLSQSGRWPVRDPEDIELLEVNLLDNYIRQWPVTRQLFQESEDFIYEGIAEMRSLALGRDDAGPEDYDAAARPTSCQFCNFRSVCIKQIETAFSPDGTFEQGALW